MKQNSQTTFVRPATGERFNVLDFAEAANIPLATARRLIKQFGNEASVLMRALAQENAAPQMAQSAPPRSQQG